MTCEYWKDFSAINSCKLDRYRSACSVLSLISISKADLFFVRDVDGITTVLISGVSKISKLEAEPSPTSGSVSSGSSPSRLSKEPTSKWEVEGSAASKITLVSCWRSCNTMNSAISVFLESSIHLASTSFGFFFSRRDLSCISSLKTSHHMRKYGRRQHTAALPGAAPSATNLTRGTLQPKIWVKWKCSV